MADPAAGPAQYQAIEDLLLGDSPSTVPEDARGQYLFRAYQAGALTVIEAAEFLRKLEGRAEGAPAKPAPKLPPPPKPAPPSAPPAGGAVDESDPGTRALDQAADAIGDAVREAVGLLADAIRTDDEIRRRIRATRTIKDGELTARRVASRALEPFYEKTRGQSPENRRPAEAEPTGDVKAPPANPVQEAQNIAVAWSDLEAGLAEAVAVIAEDAAERMGGSRQLRDANARKISDAVTVPLLLALRARVFPVLRDRAGKQPVPGAQRTPKLPTKGQPAPPIPMKGKEGIKHERARAGGG